MREIAAAAGVATGAAYYYFASKDAIVMAFYERAQEQMRPSFELRLHASRTLEARLSGIIGYKLEYFAADRTLLGALTAHTDPSHPLSPFSQKTESIRAQDIGFFARSVEQSKVKLARNLQPYLPRLLWLYQMGILLFWVYDNSLGQWRTAALLTKSLKLVVFAPRLGRLPILRPAHRLAADLLEVIYGKP